MGRLTIGGVVIEGFRDHLQEPRVAIEQEADSAHRLIGLFDRLQEDFVGFLRFVLERQDNRVP